MAETTTVHLKGPKPPPVGPGGKRTGAKITAVSVPVGRGVIDVPLNQDFTVTAAEAEKLQAAELPAEYSWVTPGDEGEATSAKAEAAGAGPNAEGTPGAATGSTGTTPAATPVAASTPAAPVTGVTGGAAPATTSTAGSSGSTGTTGAGR